MRRARTSMGSGQVVLPLRVVAAAARPPEAPVDHSMLPGNARSAPAARVLCHPHIDDRVAGPHDGGILGWVVGRSRWRRASWSRGASGLVATPHGRVVLAAAVALVMVALGGCADVDDHHVNDHHGYEHDAPPPPEQLAQVSGALSSINCGESTDTGYQSGQSFTIKVVTVDGKKVEKTTANAYYVMAEAAAKAGVHLKVVSGFRTMAEQQYLYNCYKNCSCNNCNLAAKPGYSNHQSGHALDLNTSAPGVLGWLDKNGGKYGFKRTVPSESWHWEWWGGGPGGGPCGGCKPHCEGSVIVGADCGKGDCGAYGSSCVDDALGVRCVFFACPAVGSPKVCVDGTKIGQCNNGAVDVGDCAAYGATCVHDALGARCVFGACPAVGTAKVCLDDAKIGTCDNGAIEVGDCSVYGSGCVQDSLGARCVFYACPAKGSPKVCLDDTKIGQCKDGAIEVGDCGAYAAFCSTAGASDARCISAFCVDSPQDIPVAKDVCLPDGKRYHCDADGGIADKPCPAGQPCVTKDGVGTCDAPCSPSSEACNGQDDDCDGQVDEGFGVGEPCTVGEGACTGEGEAACNGGGGSSCVAVPVSCDDGDPCTTDACDPAKGCTNVAVESCCADGSACGPGQVCEAGLCVTVLCAPCETDADCKGGGACLELQGGRHCGLPCPDGACPGGFACNDGPAGPQCAPESGACGCGQEPGMACNGPSLVQVDGCGNLLAVVEACERGCVAGACCPLGTVVQDGACAKYDPNPGHDAGGWGEDSGGGGAGGGDAGGPGAGTVDTTGWSPGSAEPPVTVAARPADDGCASTGGATPSAALLLLAAALAARRRRTRQGS